MTEVLSHLPTDPSQTCALEGDVLQSRGVGPVRYEMWRVHNGCQHEWLINKQKIRTAHTVVFIFAEIGEEARHDLKYHFSLSLSFLHCLYVGRGSKLAAVNHYKRADRFNPGVFMFVEPQADYNIPYPSNKNTRLTHDLFINWFIIYGNNGFKSKFYLNFPT